MKWKTTVLLKVLVAVSLLSLFAVTVASHEVMVVTSTEDAGLGEPRVLEIFDFQTHTWRAVEKSESSLTPAEFYRAKSIRPGTARMIENHAVVQYELRNGLAMQLATYPPSLEGAATVEYGDTFCLVGGYNTESRNLRGSVVCWNPFRSPQQNNNRTSTTSQRMGSWVALPRMQRPRFHPGAVVLDGKLYVAGGYDANTHRHLSHVEVFDDVTQKWYRVAPLNHARSGLQLAAVRGKIYAIGGWDDNHEYLDTVEEYDTIRNKWRRVARMGSPRARFGSVVRGGKVYVVGGKRGFRKRDQLRNIEVYDPKTDSWSQEEPAMSIISGPTRATIVKTT